MTATSAAFASRMQAVRDRMERLDVDTVLLSQGADLPWLTGYVAMPLERLTMLILPLQGDAVLVVPRLEAARVEVHPGLFTLRAWDETQDPVEIVTGVVGRSRRNLAIGDRTWARFLLTLQRDLPRSTWTTASRVIGPLRAVKDVEEVAALRRAAAAADRVAAELLTGQIPLVGRTEAEVSRELGERLLGEGHDSVNFAIVGAGPNSASPHHEPGARTIGANEAVVCDFGGTMAGYCSDITRTVFTGDPPDAFLDLYAVLAGAQAAAVDAARVGIPCHDVDGVARGLITDAGFGGQFIHRTGHGIGMEEHEDPYLVSGNREPLVAGHTFSVEPGIYVEGQWGARIEDIVVATDAGPDPLNRADHALAVVA
ncbi:MAG: M24 family metallopeptidase [Acidimicrobiales bacterium]